jgi:alpha-beta hydrolase superfamily lysophospholipase
MTTRAVLGRASLLAAAAAPVAAGFRFAQLYTARAGFPRRSPVSYDPADVGLAFDDLTVDGSGGPLAAWWIPATTRAGRPRRRPVPAVVLVHGWESARDRTLPHAAFLHAAGFHVLTIDVRGHGRNPEERLPITAGEFGADARAAVRAIAGRPDVSAVAVLGHSMGGIGALLAAAAEPAVAACIATSTPASPLRLTRQTFRIARLPIPGPVAWPLAWLTARVFLASRGHRLEEVSASGAAARYPGPLLLVHGALDDVIPVGHVAVLEAAARSGRSGAPAAAPVETLVVDDGRHSWLYESAPYRAAVARFLARLPGSALDPDAAAGAALAVEARRLPLHDDPFTIRGLTGERPGGLDLALAPALDADAAD